MNVSVKLEGVKEAIVKLNSLDKKTSKKLHKLVLTSAIKIHNKAKEKAPVRTGALRNSITYELEDEYTAKIGAYMPYAIYVEFGTRKMEARPYLTPAFEEVEKEFKEKLAEILRGED